MRRLIVQLPLLEALGAQWPERRPTLTRILQRSRPGHRTGSGSLESLLGLSQIPAAAVLSRLAASDKPAVDAAPSVAVDDGFWLRFDPVVQVPDMTSVWLREPAAVDLSSPGLKPLTDELAAMFEAQRMTWCRGLPVPFGLLCLDQACATDFSTLDDVLGRRLDEVLPTGSDAPRWRRLINESQMIFHQFRPLDQADQQGMGLWFWGGGRHFPAPLLREPLRIANPQRDCLVDGLARWLASANVENVEWVEKAAFSGRPGTTLLHWNPLGQALVDGLAELEQDWLAPAWHALRRGRLDSLVLRGRDACHSLTRLDSIAFWRRGRRAIDTAAGDDS
ncbi:MAG: hypothetical protein RQ741_03065 [Wenzhouxiangellaceae bacterium]|nr:hypothetical protein [Wenzhouxiangellaceae bacterium]